MHLLPPAVGFRRIGVAGGGDQRSGEQRRLAQLALRHLVPRVGGRQHHAQMGVRVVEARDQRGSPGCRRRRSWRGRSWSSAAARCAAIGRWRRRPAAGTARPRIAAAQRGEVRTAGDRVEIDVERDLRRARSRSGSARTAPTPVSAHSSTLKNMTRRPRRQFATSRRQRARHRQHRGEAGAVVHRRPRRGRGRRHVPTAPPIRRSCRDIRKPASRSRPAPRPSRSSW